jgi:cytochrome d ubiquinol oxidase subunit II
VEPYKYLHNYLTMWWALVILLLGVVMVLFGIGKTLLKGDYRSGIWPAGIGSVMVVLTLFWVVGYNNTAYLPSLLDVQSSLTLRNSSSSEFTLTVMSVVSILVPFVVAYIAYCWYKMDRKKLTSDELNNTDHKY